MPKKTKQPSKLTRALMEQKKVKVDKKDNKEIKRKNLKKQVKKKY
jgi:hypothetical protein